MRRQWAIAALCAVVLVTPLWAPMRGASRGGGSMGRATFSSQPSPGFRGSAGFSRPNFGSRSTHFSTTFGTGFRRPFHGSGRFHRGFFFRSFSPYFYGYYGYPYYSDYAYPPYDSYPGYNDAATYSAGTAQNANDLIAQQQDIDRLENEVARLREEKESREEAPAKPGQENRSEPSTPTLLIFRDKHTQEVQNYAVVGGTLWIFNERRATKLPLSWLDIDATTKANENRGVDFRVPN